MEKLITKSITLAFINEDMNLFDIEIPYSSVSVLELECITTTVGHTPSGEFNEFLTCRFLNLRLQKDSIDDQTLEAFKNSIMSITLKFNNNTSKSYNVSWRSEDGIVNSLQQVKEKDNIIKVLIG